MAYLGNKNRGETMRFWLYLDTAPTGTPTITITRGQGTALDTPISAVNMTQGASNLEWYYNYTTEAAAQVGMYNAKYSAVIDGVTRYADDKYDVSINDEDSIKSETALILADTTSIIATIGANEGASAIIINIKDGDTNNVEGVSVGIHNSVDDDPAIQTRTTDINGNTTTINLDDATYKVRLSKAGAIISETETIVVSGSATHNLTVVNQTVSNPADPDVCRLRIYPLTLGNADATGLTIDISTSGALTKVSGQFIHNTAATFTEDSSTAPDSYYFDAVRGAIVHISNDVLGLDHSITVPNAATVDLSTLIS